MTEREKFEKWYSKKYPNIDGKDCADADEFAFEIWQAAIQQQSGEAVAYRYRFIDDLQWQFTDRKDVLSDLRLEREPLYLRPQNKELEAECANLKMLLTEARDDVANQLQEYKNLLPYKQHRYDAQLSTLESIDEALGKVE